MLKKFNKKGGTQDIFLLDISKYMLSAIFFLFIIWLGVKLIFIIWPAPDPNLIALNTVSSALEEGLKNFEVLEKNNVVILPIPLRLDTIAVARIDTSGGYGNYLVAQPKICWAQVRNLDETKKDCVPINYGTKKVLIEKDNYFSIWTGVDVEPKEYLFGAITTPRSLSYIRYLQTYYIKIQKIADTDEKYIISVSRDVSQVNNWLKERNADNSGEKNIAEPARVDKAMDTFDGTKVIIVRNFKFDTEYEYKNNFWSIINSDASSPKYTYDDFFRVITDEILNDGKTTFTIIYTNNGRTESIKTMPVLKQYLDGAKLKASG